MEEKYFENEESVSERKKREQKAASGDGGLQEAKELVRVKGALGELWHRQSSMPPRLKLTRNDEETQPRRSGESSRVASKTDRVRQIRRSFKEKGKIYVSRRVLSRWGEP